MIPSCIFHEIEIATSSAHRSSKFLRHISVINKISSRKHRTRIGQKLEINSWYKNEEHGSEVDHVNVNRGDVIQLSVEWSFIRFFHARARVVPHSNNTYSINFYQYIPSYILTFMERVDTERIIGESPVKKFLTYATSDDA